MANRRISTDLKHTQGLFGDRFIGSAEVLIAAGVITAEQLPGLPGRSKVTCRFYNGVLVGTNAESKRDERFLQITRISGGRFDVHKGIPEQERAERQKKCDEGQEETTPAQYRDNCLYHVELARKWLTGDAHTSELFPFTFSAEVIVDIEDLLDEAMELIRKSGVAPLHAEKAMPGKGRLQLVWSAP